MQKKIQGEKLFFGKVREPRATNRRPIPIR